MENQIFALLPGDIVAVSDPALVWVEQDCLVVSVSLSIADDGAEVCECTLRKAVDSV